jgi:RNA polymerase sigma-70 factor (ECF subfamily)
MSDRQIQIDQMQKNAENLFIEIPDRLFDVAFSEKIEEDLEQAIDSLPDQCKLIFRLNRFENLSYPEIAKRLNVSLSTVKTQMTRAMGSLHKKMSKYL